MRRVVGIGIAVVICCGWSSHASLADPEPSLSETLSWMDNTYNSHKDTGGAAGHGIQQSFTNGNLSGYVSSSFTYKGCQMTLTVQENPAELPSLSIPISQIVNFDLKDVDPASLYLARLDPLKERVECDATNPECIIADISFETRNEIPLFHQHIDVIRPEIIGPERDSESDSMTYGAEFYFDDADYADRFFEAFRHAVQLCGGKKSPF
jgi:hypothetical protein